VRLYQLQAALLVVAMLVVFAASHLGVFFGFAQ